jgi:hypothetical protein
VWIENEGKRERERSKTEENFSSFNNRKTLSNQERLNMIKISSPPSFARVCLVGGETFSISGTASSSTEKESSTHTARMMSEWERVSRKRENLPGIYLMARKSFNEDER